MSVGDQNFLYTTQFITTNVLWSVKDGHGMPYNKMENARKQTQTQV